MSRPLKNGKNVTGRKRDEHAESKDAPGTGRATPLRLIWRLLKWFAAAAGILLTPTVLYEFLGPASPIEVTVDELRIDLTSLSHAPLALEPQLLSTATTINAGGKDTIAPHEVLWLDTSGRQPCQSFQIIYSAGGDAGADKSPTPALTLSPRQHDGSACDAWVAVGSSQAPAMHQLVPRQTVVLSFSRLPEASVLWNQLAECVSGKATLLKGGGIPAALTNDSKAKRNVRICGRKTLTVQQLLASNEDRDGQLRAILTSENGFDVTLDSHKLSWFRRLKFIQVFLSMFEKSHA